MVPNSYHGGGSQQQQGILNHNLSQGAINTLEAHRRNYISANKYLNQIYMGGVPLDPVTKKVLIYSKP